MSGIPIFNLPQYRYSETWGTINMTIAIKDYVTRCPDSRIALLGYSQVSRAEPESISIHGLLRSSLIPYRVLMSLVMSYVAGHSGISQTHYQPYILATVGSPTLRGV